MELLFADDLVLLANSEDLLAKKMWKAGMEEEGLRGSIGKTTLMRCCDSAGHAVRSGKYPCGVCSKGACSNSIQCTSCHA